MHDIGVYSLKMTSEMQADHVFSEDAKFHTATNNVAWVGPAKKQPRGSFTIGSEQRAQTLPQTHT